jgi:two-component system CheB/CheR fusion protein
MSERDPLAAQQRPRDPPASAAAAMPPVLGLCIVGIGASAGGLEACRRLLAALPPTPGMAFILVQHLDPTHESMMAELLAGFTAMPVLQAEDGMRVDIDHVYVIPPGLYISCNHGRLSLTAPLARHGLRLPFDFLLHSLAAAGARAACVILSGGGADGAIGAQAIKAAGGLVIAQDPAEAEHASMPSSAIATGAVDYVLPAAEIGSALQHFSATLTTPLAASGTAQIIALLKSLTPHDFTLYKSGTMERRIARRITLAGLSAHDTTAYMERLTADDEERRALVNDLLINVTSFFRDPKIFELLEETAIREPVTAADGTIRLWVAGCSSGEETYSLAILLLERIEAEKAGAKLQIFATDVDAEAVALARDGLYPQSIEKNVSAKRLAAFFVREEAGYRVSQALRGCVIFAVQDVLSDPPFSKLNMVSCRNLLIYLQPAAQSKLIDLFNFALRDGGFLLLGAAETVTGPDRRFEQISKPARLYRKIADGGNSRLPSSSPITDFLRLTPRAVPPVSRGADLAEICRKLVLERYAPAALLINARLECLYVLGGTDAFLRTPAGAPSHDLLAQLPSGIRAQVREAVSKASAGQDLVRIEGGRITRDGITRQFALEIRPVPGDASKFLVTFFNRPAAEPSMAAALPADGPRAIELEAELAATRAELEQAVRDLENATEEHNAVNEEALSVNEEFQSTNEELLTSKEELQSLNEELTALNSQLQETLERSRMTTADLRNVLNSTDVPTLFLDEALRIRFFTPSSTALFPLISSDIGRPLADFQSLAHDPALLSDATQVLATALPSTCEIHAANSTWYSRRIQPYRTYDGVTGGVVITFTDITGRKANAAALEAARQDSERANIAKSRFLAAASHDLRQPLQSMALINGMLGKTVTEPSARKLVARLDHTMQSITAMLDAMLDINQIEAGIVQPTVRHVRAADLLTILDDKFRDLANAQQTDLRVVPCSLSITTDPDLLEQMLTNLLGNALKYTKAGRVLLGCRRRGGMLRIEVWDTGIGIAPDQLKSIFDEYHQIDNSARERSRGLGLGLSIVRRLGDLLGAKIAVISTPGKGSGFSIEIPRSPAPPPPVANGFAIRPLLAPGGAKILVIEDDPDISQLLGSFLTEEGFSPVTAHDAAAAKTLVTSGAIIPDLILADFNLPGAETGLQAALALRAYLHRPVPTIVMTGDISTGTLRLIAEQKCVQMNKPMKLTVLMETILLQLAAVSAPSQVAPEAPALGGARVYIFDDDPGILDEMRAAFEGAGLRTEIFGDAERFLAALPSVIHDSVLLVDAALPGMSGLDLLAKLAADSVALPAIMITGLGDVSMAVQAMKAGAADFLEKPVNAQELLACVRVVLAQSHGQQEVGARKRDAAVHIASLTARQREVLERVLAGQPSKNIAADLGISQRTVESHRAAIMEKTGAKSIPELARLAVVAASSEGG